MQRTFKWIALVSLLLVVLLAGGCGTKNAAKTGSLSLFLVDAPVNNLDEVNVRITRVDVNRDGKWETLNDFSEQEDSYLDVNLLDLRFDKALLGEKDLPPGAYNQIRLIVSETDSNVVVAGNAFPLKTPSGAQTGLKINHNFYIPAGGAVALILDADVSEFVHQRGNKDEYIMSPTAVRVADLQSGTISGTVLARLGNAPITNTDVTITVWLDSNGDGIADAADPETEAISYVARTLALRENFNGHSAGEFQVNAVPTLTTGKYIVEVTADGYSTKMFTNVTVSPGSNTVVDGDPVLTGINPILLDKLP